MNNVGQFLSEFQILKKSGICEGYAFFALSEGMTGKSSPH